MFYICDPKKNTKCNKKGCGTACKLTSHQEFSATSDKPKDNIPTLSEAKTKIKDKNDERKEKVAYKDGPVLPRQDMEGTTPTDINS